jgi:hypothetical protein
MKGYAMTALLEETKITVTMDTITENAQGTLIKTRAFDGHSFELGDLVYLVGMAGLSRFSTDAPTAQSQLMSADDPSGQCSILTINTLDGAAPTPEQLVEIGEIYGIQFKHNPFLTDHRRAAADAAFENADLLGREVAAPDGWDHGHDELVQKVFLENGDDDSQIMMFRVNFKPNSSNLLGEPEFEVPEMTGSSTAPQF